MEPDDFELCNGMFTRILEHHGDNIDVSRISEEERVVLLVWHVSGIVGNGGFRYLFEGSILGDPYFVLTVEAFQKTGCEKASEALKKTLAIFPHSRPPQDINERLRYYLTRIKGEPTGQELQFWKANDELKRQSANYIRARHKAFANLDITYSKRAPVRQPHASQVLNSPVQDTSPTLADLPQWARVAFAAHCAKQVFPFQSLHWPKVSKKYSNGIQQAIELAERSAAEGQAVEGLENAITNAIISAGRALSSRLELGDEPPENAYLGTIASIVAKAAEKAAASASAFGEESVLCAMEAWSYAKNVMETSEEVDMPEKLQEDFIKLHRAAVRGKWTDQTKIPTEIWSLL